MCRSVFFRLICLFGTMHLNPGYSSSGASRCWAAFVISVFTACRMTNIHLTNTFWWCSGSEAVRSTGRLRYPPAVLYVTYVLVFLVEIISISPCVRINVIQTNEQAACSSHRSWPRSASTYHSCILEKSHFELWNSAAHYFNFVFFYILGLLKLLKGLKAVSFIRLSFSNPKI